MHIPRDISPTRLAVLAASFLSIGIVAGALLGPRLAPKIFIDDGYTSGRNTPPAVYEGEEINRPPQSITRPSGTTCIQVVTPAKNSRTGEIQDFPTPCDIPEDWEKISD